MKQKLKGDSFAFFIYVDNFNFALTNIYKNTGYKQKINKNFLAQYTTCFATWKQLFLWILSPSVQVNTWFFYMCDSNSWNNKLVQPAALNKL